MITANTTIAKRFSFEAAHRLANHDGKCRNLHGHSYVIEVGVEGPLNWRSGAPDEGMVVDFSVVSDLFKEHVYSKCDHAYLHASDGSDPIPENVGKVAELPIQATTAELIAAWILGEMGGALRHPVARVAFVRVYETATSYAEVRA